MMSGYGQVCYTDIVPGYYCSVALRPLSFYNLPTITHSVVFSVLGARSVHLDVVTLWADHHPVDLKLSFSKDASNSTTLHVSPRNRILISKIIAILFIPLECGVEY